MPKKLYFIYTNPRFMAALYEPTLSAAFGGRDDVEVRFVLDDSLVADTAANNQAPPPGVVRRLYALVENCVAGGADCVVVGCTAVNLAVRRLRDMASVPLVGIDQPLVEAVEASGAKSAAVISHSKINAETVARMFTGVKAECVVPDGAAKLFAAGDRAELERVLFRAAEQAAKGRDAVAFAHISTDAMPSLDALPRPAYRIGALAVDAILNILHLPKKA